MKMERGPRLAVAEMLKSTVALVGLLIITELMVRSEPAPEIQNWVKFCAQCVAEPVMVKTTSWPWLPVAGATWLMIAGP